MNWWIVGFWAVMWLALNAVFCAAVFPPSTRWVIWRVMTLIYVIVVVTVYLTSQPEFLFGER